MEYVDYESIRFRETEVAVGQGIRLQHLSALADNFHFLRNIKAASLPGNWIHPCITEMVHHSGAVFWTWQAFGTSVGTRVLVDRRDYAGALAADFGERGFFACMVRVKLWCRALANGQNYPPFMPGGANDHEVGSPGFTTAEGFVYLGDGSSDHELSSRHVIVLAAQGCDFIFHVPRNGDYRGSLLLDFRKNANDGAVAIIRVESSPRLPTELSL